MEIVIWSKYQCPNCDQAKSILKSKGLDFTEKKIGDGYTREDLLEIVPTARTVPQIIIDGQVVGGLTELRKFLETNG